MCALLVCEPIVIGIIARSECAMCASLDRGSTQRVIRSSHAICVLLVCTIVGVRRTQGLHHLRVIFRRQGWDPRQQPAYGGCAYHRVRPRCARLSADSAHNLLNLYRSVHGNVCL